MLSTPSSLSLDCTVLQNDSQLAPSGTGTATFLSEQGLYVEKSWIGDTAFEQAHNNA